MLKLFANTYFAENPKAPDNSFMSLSPCITCRQAIFAKDPNLLPPQAGFFFGSYDIDEWYWQDIKDTIKKIDRVLALPEMSKLSFYYTSSW